MGNPSILLLPRSFVLLDTSLCGFRVVRKGNNEVGSVVKTPTVGVGVKIPTVEIVPGPLTPVKDEPRVGYPPPSSREPSGGEDERKVTVQPDQRKHSSKVHPYVGCLYLCAVLLHRSQTR